MKKGTKLYVKLDTYGDVAQTVLEESLEDNVIDGILSDGDTVYVFEMVGKGEIESTARVVMSGKKT